MRLRARYVAFVVLGFLFELLPERVGGAVVGGAVRAVGLLPRWQRSALRDNLAMALAGGTGLPVDDAVLDRYLARALRAYGRYWSESAKLPVIARNRASARLRVVEGEAYLRDAVNSGRGTLLALPHVGSWDWGGAFLADMDWTMTTVVEVLEPPALFEWFAAKREAIGLRVVPLGEGGSVTGVLRAGGVVGLLCDRDLQNNGVGVELFGAPTTVPGGPATLAMRTGAVLLCTAVYSGPGRDHHVVVTPPIDTQRRGRLRDDVARVSQEVTDQLGWLIRRAPEQWHVLQPIWPST